MASDATLPPSRVMTESSYETEAVAPAPKSAIWEDFIDIFYAPRSVFERRENSSPWPAFIVVTLLFIIISFATFNALSPAIENEMRTQFAKNPKMTEDMINTSVGWALKIGRFASLGTPIILLVVSLWYWVVGYPFSNVQRTIRACMMVVGYSYIVKCVAAIAIGVQALMIDPVKLTSPFVVTLSAARLVDRAATSPVLFALLTKIDLFDFWYITLLAIGLMVIGKASRTQAILFGVTYWALGAGWAVVSALRAAAAAG
jgi:hypothetical protein